MKFKDLTDKMSENQKGNAASKKAALSAEMSQSVNNLVALALALTPSGEIGDGMVARFHQLAREVIDEGKPESTDAALAIGEHAFTAGYEAARLKAAFRDDFTPEELEEAWSEYDPPEDIKALTGELSGEPVAWVYELAAWRNGDTDEVGGWQKRISFERPNVHPGSIRNLRALR